jgi:hypothetical protein
LRPPRAAGSLEIGSGGGISPIPALARRVRLKKV